MKNVPQKINPKEQIIWSEVVKSSLKPCTCILKKCLEIALENSIGTV